MSESRVAAATAGSDESEGMSYLSTLPQRLVRVYLPLTLSVFVLLFPFYWMTMTAIKPKEHLLDLDTHNPFFTLAPTFEHIHDLLFKGIEHLTRRDDARETLRRRRLQSALNQAGD